LLTNWGQLLVVVDMHSDHNYLGMAYSSMEQFPIAMDMKALQKQISRPLPTSTLLVTLMGMLRKFMQEVLLLS